MNIGSYEIVNNITNNTLNITKVPGESYDSLAEKIFRADCPYFAAPVKEVSINGKTMYKYYLEGCMPIASLNMRMSGHEFMQLLKNLLNPLKECCDWMLDSRCFIMDTNLVFVNEYDFKVKYIYSFNLSNRCGDSEITGFFSEIIKNARIIDSVDLNNELLRMVVDGNVSVASLNELVNRYNSDKNSDHKQGVKNYDMNVREDKSNQRMSRNSAVQEKSSNLQERSVSRIAVQTAEPEVRSPQLTGNAEEASAAVISGESGIFSDEKSDTMEKIFGAKKQKSPKIKKKKTVTDKKSGDLLSFFKKNPKQTNSYANTAYDLPDDETVFIGNDGETVFAVAAHYLIIKERRGSLPAPERIDILLNDNNEMYIGRSSGKSNHTGYEFSPEFKKISRRHAKISHMGGDYYLTDLDSANGTVLDGETLLPNTPCLIKNGSMIIFGDSDYVYEFCTI